MSGKKDQSRIVQKYIENPFIVRNPDVQLLHNKKFDIRQWVLVTSLKPLQIYLFSSCYLRICSAEFDIQDFKNPMRHLTNFAVNKTQYKDRMEESVCPLDTFVQYIKEHCDTDWDSQVKPQVVSLVTDTIISAADKLLYKPGCFELYGFDIMLDEALKPWLLEVNLSPACTERTPWLSEMLDHMAEGMLKLVLPKSVLSTEEVPDTDVVSLPQKSEYQWELIHSAEEIGGNIDANGKIVTGELEIIGVKANIKKEKDLDKQYFRYMYL